MKKLEAINTFIDILNKHASSEESKTTKDEKNEKDEKIKVVIEKIKFNSRVSLYLMCQEPLSQIEIFEKKGMKHIVNLLECEPQNINDKIRFSRILAKFSSQTPNLKIGSMFSIFVKPFFYILNDVFRKELDWFISKPAVFYICHVRKDILKKDDDEDSDEEFADK